MKFIIHSNYGMAGGHQSAHQICAGLTHHNQDAYMVYPPVGHDCVVPLWNELYGVEKFLHRESIDDEPDQVHLLPANWGPNWYPCDNTIKSCINVTGNNPYKSTKVFFWLGITPWQDWEIGGLEAQVNLDHPNLQKMFHACQSTHAYDYLIKSGKFNPQKIFMLRDYTNEFFLHTDYELYTLAHKRGNIVLYNGAKGIEHTNKIIEACSDVNCIFVKLENLNRQEIKDLALKSKVYIDFGHHPGKDRIPREMAASGCIVITGNEGTASCKADMPIGSRKFEKIGDEYNYQEIKTQISKDIDNYMLAFLDEDQVAYRVSIRQEKQTVYKDIANMIRVLENKKSL